MPYYERKVARHSRDERRLRNFGFRLTLLYRTLPQSPTAPAPSRKEPMVTLVHFESLDLTLDSICTNRLILYGDNYMNVVEHYDILIDENNDPVYDPDSLKKYMDKWDGQVFIDAMKLDKTKNILEIGVGTGRLALKTIPLCKEFVGIDLSPKTIERATHNLSQYKNLKLICDDFMTHNFGTTFDVVYSSLTFMHIKEKQQCINKIYSLLNPKGILVLSIDKNKKEYINYGERKIKIYPDNLDNTKKYFINSYLTLLDCIETEFAYILVGLKS